MGTALFQLGEHTLAKAEHLAVLDALELGGSHSVGDGGYDVYVETLVNLHRSSTQARFVVVRHYLWKATL